MHTEFSPWLYYCQRLQVPTVLSENVEFHKRTNCTSSLGIFTAQIMKNRVDLMVWQIDMSSFEVYIFNM